MKIRFTSQNSIIFVLVFLFVLSMGQNMLFYVKYRDALDLLTYSATTIYDDDERFVSRRKELEAKILSSDKRIETDSVIGDLLDRAESLGIERDYVRAELYNFAILDDRSDKKIIVEDVKH